MGGQQRAAEQQQEGGEMAHDPRGGWHFANPVDDRAHGATARPPPLGVARGTDPSQRPEGTDPQRLRFRGDPQHPPQSFAHGGTQGTWDRSLGTEPVPEAAPRLLASATQASPSPPVPHEFIARTPDAVPPTGPHDSVVASSVRPEGL